MKMAAVQRIGGALLCVMVGCSISRGGYHAREMTSSDATRPPLQSPGELGEVERGPRGKSEVALTFDAGGEADCFDDLIAALEKVHAHCTFFVTGHWAQKNRECTEAIAAHGHEVGNHTWNHRDLTTASDDIVRDEIVRADAILTEISGRSPRPLFRAPYGARDRRVLRIAHGLGYRSIYWTIDSLDSVDPPKTPAFLIDRIANMSDRDLDGAIVLLHVGEKSTAQALPAIIATIEGRGFRPVTLSTLLQ